MKTLILGIVLFSASVSAIEFKGILDVKKVFSDSSPVDVKTLKTEQWLECDKYSFTEDVIIPFRDMQFSTESNSNGVVIKEKSFANSYYLIGDKRLPAFSYSSYRVADSGMVYSTVRRSFETDLIKTMRAYKETIIVEVTLRDKATSEDNKSVAIGNRLDHYLVCH